MREKLQRAGFTLLDSTSETIRESYDDIGALFASLRAIGAGNKRTDRPRGLLTPRQLKRVEASYPIGYDGIIASWVVQTLIARKA